MQYESMVYTMGMALSRAMESNAEVELLVDGIWLTGRVVVSDGYGVVIEAGDDEHSIVKVDAISACRIAQGAPVPRLTAKADGFVHATPMPGPRRAG